jgi:hypothetical protein
MENNSPLSKFKRQPKLYIDLPSKGIWYPKGTLDKAEELEVYSMTANDEISIKTPDALYTGHAITRVIENCVPAIKNAWLIPMPDMDYILASIRLASYGEDIELSNTCSSCKNEDTYKLGIKYILDYTQSTGEKQTYEIAVEGFKFFLRPLTYKEYTEIQQNTIQIQRTLYQSIAKMEEGEEKQKRIDEMYTKLADITKFAVCTTIIRVETPEGETEDNPKFIQDFLINGDKEFFNAVKKAYLDNQDVTKLPKVSVTCSQCDHEDEATPNLDYASFFVTA